MKEVIVALITSSIWRRFHVAIFFLQGMDSLFIIINKIFGTRRTKYPSTTPTMVSSYEKRKVRLALKTAVSFLVCLPPGKIIDTFYESLSNADMKYIEEMPITVNSGVDVSTSNVDERSNFIYGNIVD